MATIRDVAEWANVSPITVSRVLNEQGYVKAATRARILDAIQALNYVPNLQARSLRSRRTHTLALLLTDVTNPFWTTVARGVEDKAAENNFSVILCNTDEDPAKEQRYLRVMLEKRVDGMIVAPTSYDGSSLRRLTQQSIPYVVIDRRLDRLETDIVLTDNVAAARGLVAHLVALGHRRIGIITGNPGISTGEERLLGYTQALAEAAIPEDPMLIQRGPFVQATGYSLALELLSLPSPPTAIVACNNFIAFGALLALRARGLSMPEDVQLASFDEFPLLSLFCPSLKVAVQPAYQMGAVATDLLLARVAGQVVEPKEVVLETRLDFGGGSASTSPLIA
jgi:LacI family transcriptional regulator